MGGRELEFGSLKIGKKTLEDVILNLDSLKARAQKNYSNKNAILKALADKDAKTLREISDYFYRTNGIYFRVCNYFAQMYRYDWYIVPEVYDESKVKEDKLVVDFNKALNFLDNSYIKKTCADIALQVIKNGAYYGCIISSGNSIILQELPVGYCRSRYNVGNLPAVEFNMRFFDVMFPDTAYRMQVLNLFPDEFKKGYMAYKTGKLNEKAVLGQEPTIDLCGRWQRENGWWLLDPEKTMKFSFSNGAFGGGDIPLFINAIPAILDLDAAQDLDRRKQMQKLLKIIVQKLPMDKNGDLIFDVDEARDIHNNAVQMLKRAVGVDVLTTFADIDSIDMSDKNTTTSQDDLQKVERSVYNALGISQNLFNTDGNLSLNSSILNDEGALRTLVLQFNVLFDRLTQACSANKKKYNFRLYMLETTQYNYKELSKLYKEHVQMGYSKMLPQIALGHSQSSILNTAYFENEVLHLSEIMIPPLMSSTMNMQDLKGNSGEAAKNKTQNNTGGQKAQAPKEEKAAGRPEKPDDQKSAKTIQNKESMS